MLSACRTRCYFWKVVKSMNDFLAFLRVGLPGISQAFLALSMTLIAIVDDGPDRPLWIAMALVGAGGVYMSGLAACELGRRKAEQWLRR